MTNTVVLGKFGRPHGVRGEVRFFPYNPESDVLQPGVVFDVENCSAYEQVTLESLRSADRFIIVRLVECPEREDVALLTNHEVSVPRDLLPDPDPDEFYLIDAIGLEVWGCESAGDDLRLLGNVKGWLEGTATDVMSVTGPDIKGRLLVPYTEAAVTSVDIESGRIELTPFDEWASPDEER